MTKNIKLQKQAQRYYLHFDTDAMREEEGERDGNIICFDIALTEKELKALKKELK